MAPTQLQLTEQDNIEKEAAHKRSIAEKEKIEVGYAFALILDRCMPVC